MKAKIKFRPRKKLPPRRAAETVEIFHNGKKMEMGVGFCPKTGQPHEIFIKAGGPRGSEMSVLLDDVGVIISRLLQRGESPADLACGLGRAGGRLILGGGDEINEASPFQPTSIIGVAADYLAATARLRSPPPTIKIPPPPSPRATPAEPPTRITARSASGTRTCLGCSRSFFSKWAGNRLCPKCKQHPPYFRDID